ncbi:hypothetical protein BLNAU_29 [Blattamonas nauphoetae]|uniref:Uncharacterized protein n=1 Tax=Blattamonas nauphoetae TaxID=2049346 RepID=A0ABQ9YMG1_9EUKA|nr:hypothetical protein BLNAU_29 [Blattamonas nauphoetae]
MNGGTRFNQRPAQQEQPQPEMDNFVFDPTKDVMNIMAKIEQEDRPQYTGEFGGGGFGGGGGYGGGEGRRNG